MLNLNNPNRPAFYGMPIKFLPSPLLVKPYSTKELSMIYGVSTKTFLKWLLPFTHLIGEKKGRFYTVRQVETIFDRLGMPYSI